MGLRNLFFHRKDIVASEVDIGRLALSYYIKEVLFQTDFLHSFEEELYHDRQHPSSIDFKARYKS